MGGGGGGAGFKKRRLRISNREVGEVPQDVSSQKPSVANRKGKSAGTNAAPFPQGHLLLSGNPQDFPAEQNCTPSAWLHMDDPYLCWLANPDEMG